MLTRCNAAHLPQVGLLAVETSTGDVLYGLASTGLVQSQLEAALLAIAPVEVLAVGELLQQTERTLAAYLASASGNRREDVPGAGYLDVAAVEKLTEFYKAGGQQEEGHGRSGGGSELDFVLGLPSAVLRVLAAALEYLSKVRRMAQRCAQACCCVHAHNHHGVSAVADSACCAGPGH
jgi:DNA mismatch repair protein MSH3